jgi:hypothetical protein
MINILIATFGVMIVIGGFYAMSFGFSTPPSISFFFTGLVLTVFGAMMVILFGSKINIEDLKMRSKKEKVPKASSNTSKSVKDTVKAKSVPRKAEIPESPKKIQPIATKKPQESNIKKLVTNRKDFVKEDQKKQVVPKKIGPKRVSKDTISQPEKTGSNENKPKVAPLNIKPKPEKIGTEENKPKVAPIDIKSISAGKKLVLKDKSIENEPKLAPKEIKPIPTDKTDEKPKKFTDRVKSPFIRKKSSPESEIEEDKPEVVRKKVEPVRRNKSEDEFVKNRLDRLKENYIKNAQDIENLIEERLDSFKGTLDQIKSESKDPSIIWSFDAGDVQETMQDTILKADKKILMMYPWVRNIDVSVLKRFMETDSKIILQEASLDDDASVELIKLLMDNNVKIRTMPHVHTVAIVSDEDNGLIISTDPIYESFEVGVIYKDQKSIEEIERMFGEAWELSQEIDLTVN